MKKEEKKRAYKKPKATAKKINHFFFSCHASAQQCTTMKQPFKCKIK